MMARFPVGRARGFLLLATVALVAAGCVNFTGSKVITNGESSGPFVVRITCEGTDPESEDLTFTGESTETTMDFELPIDFQNFQASTTCTITEIEQAGATSVTYQCGEIEFLLPLDTGAGSSRTPSAGGPGMSVTRGETPGEATCTETPEGLVVEITVFTEVEVSVSFTVINDFTPTTTTTLPEPPPDPAPAEAVASQVVTFTG
jgi:hypothetical protein